MFFLTGHLAENYLLVGIKLFSTTFRKKKLQEDKGLGEYVVLEKKSAWAYKGSGEKKGPEEDEKS